MQNLRRYTGMLATITVIVLAGYAGMAAAATWESGACNAYYLNGGWAGGSTNGCCEDENNDYGAWVTVCANGANTCNSYTDANGDRHVDCF